jgi:hypothetical protein
VKTDYFVIHEIPHKKVLLVIVPHLQCTSCSDTSGSNVLLLEIEPLLSKYNRRLFVYFESVFLQEKKG